jgi:peptidoglycan/LPS O-acetylase OafA/YrhL
MASSATRYDGLDWLRAAAALAVVAPGLAWPVHDPQPSAIVDALTWWIDAWIMPLFFIISGFLAAQLYARLGPTEFLKHRARRLLAPLVFACVVILPLDLYVWLLGWVIEDRIPLKKLRSLKLGDAGSELWGTAHLWYLEYLVIFCIGAWAVHWGRQRFANRRARHSFAAQQATTPDTGSQRFPLSAFRFPLSTLAACSALALWWDPQLVIGFRHAWHPLPANVLYYAPCFAAGWWMQARDTPAAGTARWLIAGAKASPVLLATILPLVHAYATSGMGGPLRVVLAAAFTASGWLMAIGLCQMMLPCAVPPRSVRYLAQASFWMYLFHHPAVGLAQVALHGSGLNAEAKFLLVWVSATGLSLLTYEACVRRTWIGALLNGRRATRSPIVEAAAPHRRAA